VGPALAGRGDLGRAEAVVTAIRLPPWSEILAEDAPWGVLLHAGPAGLWLLRSEAEAVDGLEVRVVAGGACTTAGALFEEFATALEEEPPEDWAGFEDLVARGAAIASALLVSEAGRLLEREPLSFGTLLASLRGAAERRTLRVVFQGRDLAPGLLALLREFGLNELA
jgi:hypothetical protein